MTSLVTVKFEHVSGLPQDRVINTFHIGPSVNFVALTNAEITAVRDALQRFYLDPPGVHANSISAYMGSQLSRLVPPVTRFYEGVIPPANAGSPYGGLDFSANLDPAANGTELPSEVAIVLSYRHRPFFPVDPRRLRGRIYIGPLNLACVDDTALDGPRPSVEAQQVIAESAARLLLELNPAPGANTAWSVFSRGPFVPTRPQGAQVNEVEEGFVDDAFDTQRRRGERTKSRTLWT